MCPITLRDNCAVRWVRSVCVQATGCKKLSVLRVLKDSKSVELPSFGIYLFPLNQKQCECLWCRFSYLCVQLSFLITWQSVCILEQSSFLWCGVFSSSPPVNSALMASLALRRCIGFSSLPLPVYPTSGASSGPQDVAGDAVSHPFPAERETGDACWLLLWVYSWLSLYSLMSEWFVYLNILGIFVKKLGQVRSNFQLQNFLTQLCLYYPVCLRIQNYF